MREENSSKIRLAIFASGSGSNAEAIVAHFKNHPTIKVEMIVTNRERAGVIDRAKRLGIPYTLIPKSTFDNKDAVLKVLEEANIDWIILAGWLLLIPTYLVQSFPDRIINIHPALLPKFGGKGMYGMHVHQAVVDAQESESGITIHLVNERFDDGRILAQYKFPLPANATAEDVEAGVRQLEISNYAAEIEKSVL
ncbi:MAG TPA: phosphoribosylglycinamide formyltransferase [Flavobacteriales bacterium]|jgi:phosphoribosylglycinamide formyltransferase 1|nr:phosphoribosylglycinamide formyltransferase [Flavobacteriales bacterium]HAW21065.1 phosphoribosylglycinamide formyltransferase [Flavobacteriales bacterium]